jgi:hypothetical protein
MLTHSKELWKYCFIIKTDACHSILVKVTDSTIKLSLILFSHVDHSIESVTFTSTFLLTTQAKYIGKINLSTINNADKINNLNLELSHLRGLYEGRVGSVIVITSCQVALEVVPATRDNKFSEYFILFSSKFCTIQSPIQKP